MNPANRFTPFSLAGRKALITGGASGIGRAAAGLFTQLGAQVVIADLVDVAFGPVMLDTGALKSIACDVSNEADVVRAVRETVDVLGGFDTLLHCAGVAYVASALEQGVDEWQKVMDINLRGTYLVCCTAANHMVRQGTGSITAISSVAGQRGYPRRSAYGTSKAAVASLIRTFACEWGEHGVRVNSIAPGYIRTAMVDDLASNGTFDLKRTEGRTPMGRLGTPEDVARSAAFLASPWAAYITGAELFVDGGWSAFSGSGDVQTF